MTVESGSFPGVVRPVKTVGVVGAGYVGLVTAASLAHKGFNVVIAEQDSRRRVLVRQGTPPFFEPRLAEFLQAGIAAGTIVVVDSVQEMFATALVPTVVISCVGTPPRHDGSPDISYALSVVKQVGQLVTQDLLFVHKSTLPVGLTRETDKLLKTAVKSRNLSIKIAAASNPEFLREGSAINDFLYPSRVVCGVADSWSRDLLYALHEPFLGPKTQFLVFGFESAELTKYAANSMLATRLSFMNQLALLADQVGADIEEVRVGIGSDERIGMHYLGAGIGYGGSCLPKDVRALDWIGRTNGVDMSLVRSVDAINQDLINRFVKKILEFYGPEFRGKHVGIWGLAFKPETDDTRYAPSIPIINALLTHEVVVTAFDPKASIADQVVQKERYSEVRSAREVLELADCLLILTEWPEFLTYTPDDLAIIADRVIFDGRNCFDPYLMIAHGFSYFCMGRNLLTKELPTHPLRPYTSPTVRHP